MSALVRYQLALLLRSQRWLPPLLLYAVCVGVGLQAGQPLLDSLGFAAAALLPVAAWLVRVCVTGEPESARHCAAAALGPARTHLASVLAGFLSSAVLGAAGTAVVLVISDPHTTDGATRVPLLPAAGAGLLAALACALFGTAVGALCNRPLLHSTGWAVCSTMLAALLVLVVGVSPANAAVRGLVTASHDGAVPVPWLPFAVSCGVAAAATAVACALASRRR
ncbi:ABC transporter [Streptomyces armeniacus]|uniref:ABC transporter n=1 Tax=Streptomyces armeniacus TaxID=83291 RepID=A0A345XMK5_9ACTN|nr:ABC transporter [Streptomyces armeniacus]AXK32871.1 ABC transporter [Streptomyces armeniacus]